MSKFKKPIWMSRVTILVLIVTVIVCIWGALYSSTLIGNPDISTVFAYPIVFYQLHNLAFTIIYVALAWISATFLFGKWLRKVYITQAAVVAFAGMILAIIATCAYENTALKMSWGTLFIEVLSAFIMFYIVGVLDNKRVKRVSELMWDFAFTPTKVENSSREEERNLDMARPVETISEKDPTLSDNTPKPGVLDDSVNTPSVSFKENKVATSDRPIVVGPTTKESSVQEGLHQSVDNPFDMDPDLDLSKLQDPYAEDDNKSVEVVNELPHDYGEPEVDPVAVSDEIPHVDYTESDVSDSIVEPEVDEAVETPAVVVDQDSTELEALTDVDTNNSSNNGLDFGPNPDPIEENNSDDSMKNKAANFLEKVADKVSEKAESMKTDSPKDGNK